MDVREKLVELLSKYFNIGDSYAYNLTRVKSAFACGTMGFDDFEEFDEETVEDIASYLIKNSVTVQEQDGCEHCRTASYTEKPFTVITQMGREVKTQFNFCPNCGRRLQHPPKGE